MIKTLEDLQDLKSTDSAGITNGQLHEIIVAAIAEDRASDKASRTAAAPSSDAMAARLDLYKLPDEAVINQSELSIILQLSTSRLEKRRVAGDPPPFIRGRPVKYYMGDVRAMLKSGLVKNTAEASVIGTLQVSRLMDTHAIFTYADNLKLGFTAAAAYQETNDEEVYQSVEVLCVGEFKHMQLAEDLFTEPRQTILPDVAKEFDIATWTLLELTNGKQPRVQALVQGISNLVESGNDLNQPNNLIGYTVAHVIARYGEKLDIQEVTLLMETLIEKGLDFYQEDNQNKQALDYAEDGSKVQQWDRSRSLSRGLESSLAIKDEKPKKPVFK